MDLFFSKSDAAPFELNLTKFWSFLIQMYHYLHVSFFYYLNHFIISPLGSAQSCNNQRISSSLLQQ